MVGTLPVIREHLVATPDTCGGRPRIAGTRIRVQDVGIWHVHLGLTPSEIVSKWPQLSLSAIYAALSYYHDHREALNSEIAADQATYEEQCTKASSLLAEKPRRAGVENAANDPLPPG